MLSVFGDTVCDLICLTETNGYGGGENFFETELLVEIEHFKHMSFLRLKIIAHKTTYLSI
jgi:hypothetical protein